MKSFSPITLAALIMGIGIAGIPLGDTAAKTMFLAGGVDPLFVAWSRYGLGIFLVWFAFMGRGFEYAVFLDWRMWMRSVFVTGAIVLILTSLNTEPLADAFAVFFVGPIFAYFGAAFLLREKITLFRTITLLMAFIGVLIVARPGANASFGLVYAFLGGCCYAAFLVSTRWLAGVARPRTLLFANLVMGTLLITPAGLLKVPELDASLVGLVVWSAAASAVGNLAIVLASALVDGSRVAPLIYLQVAYAAFFGVVFFGDVPDLVTWLGIALLVSSGFASFFAQRKLPR